MNEGLERTSDVNVIEDDERDNCALFLGDLSIFCDEKDIEGAFSTFGEIVDIRIQRSKETSRALSYGFIEFADPNAAAAALDNMNYYLLKGRPLRIRWAASRKNPVKSAMTPHDSAATVYVRFLSQSPEVVVSEESLRELFNNYGPVFDCAIKKLSQDQKTNRTKGYAFVSFDSGVLIHGGVDVAGVDAAYRASIDLRNCVVNNVRYRCELGYRLHKQYANMNQQQQGCYGVDGMPLPMSMPMISANLNVYIPPPPQQQQDVYAQGYAAMGAGTSYPPIQMQQQPQFAPPIQQQQQHAEQNYASSQVPQQQHHQQQQYPQQHPPQRQQPQQPQQQQMPRQGQAVPVSQMPSYNQQEKAPTPAPAAYPSAYSLASYSFSPTAMVSSILGSNRSPTAYELHQLQQLQTHSAMCTPHSTPRNASVPAQAQQGQYASAYMATAQGQHGYSYTMPMNATSLLIQQQQQQQHVPVTPMYSQQHQGQYISHPYQFQYYPSSANSTPTNARHDGNLRTRSMSTDAGSYSNASMMMPMPTVVVMPMQPPQQQQAYNQNYSSAPLQQPQQQYLNSPDQGQQSGSHTPGKAYSPSTPRGSCSEYFATVKGLDLSINTMPPSMHPAYEMTAAVLQGSAENTPKSIYTTRKTTPGARRQMYDMRQADMRQADMRQQQLQHQHQVHMNSNAGPQNMQQQQQQQAGKAPSRRNSNESIGTTSLFLGGSGEDSGPEMRSSVETDVGTMKHPPVGVEGQVN